MGYDTILGRYLSKQLISTFLLCLFMVAGIVFLFDMIEILRKYSGNDGANAAMLFKLGISRMPETFNMVFPFVILIAAQTTFYKLSKSNEYVIIRTAGADLWQFLKPFLYTTFLIGVFNIMLLNPLLSKMHVVHETLTNKIENKNAQTLVFSEKGLWIREVEGNKSRIINAKSLNKEDDSLLLRNILIVEFEDDRKLTKRIEAFAGVLKDGAIDLKDVNIYQLGNPTQKMASYKYKTTLDNKRVQDSFIEPEAVSFWQLPKMISFYNKSGFSIQKYLISFLSLLALPFLLCSLVLLAAIFSLQSTNRKGSVMYLIVSGLSTGFLIYFLSQLIYAFGANNMFPSFLAASAPTLIVGLVSVSVLLQKEER